MKRKRFWYGLAVVMLIIILWSMSMLYLEADVSQSIDVYIDYTLSNQLSSIAQATSVTISPKILIGIGCQKCGSTYLNHLLYINFNRLENIHVAAKELHYWNECFFPHITRQFLKISKTNMHAYKCNVEEYLSLHWNWSHSLNDAHSSTAQLFIEKSPVYFKYYHSSYLLSMHAHIHDISFYLLLRNPINRVWSSYWMYAKMNRFERQYNKSDIHDVKRIERMIASDINRFDSQYPYFSEMLSLLKDDTVNETEMVQLWRYGVYNVYSKFNAPNLVKSCYFPQLIMWWNNLNSATFPESIQSEQRFKILQSSELFENPKQIACSLMRWMQQSVDCDRIRIRSTSRMQNSFAPRIVDITELNVYPVLQEFYRDCNHKLYDFISSHPQLLLTGNFTPFW